MEVFELIFTPCMLLMPLVFVQFYRPDPEAELDMERVRRLRRRLLGFTALALLIFFGAYFAARAGHMTWWEELPAIVTFGMALHKVMWMMFFPLWFALAMPLLATLRPEMASPFANPKGEVRQTRSASLAPRVEPPSARAGAWKGMLGLWLVGATLVALLCWQRAEVLEREQPTYLLVVVVSLGCGLLPVAIYPTVLRALLAESEPMDERNSPELSEAYASLRTTKLRGHLVFSYIMELLMLSLALITVGLSLETNVQAIGGAVLGSVVGIGGATFGVLMSNRRMRINRLLSKLAES